MRLFIYPQFENGNQYPENNFKTKAANFKKEQNIQRKQAYENITSNLTSLFGSIRSIYHSLKYIFDDDKAVVKVNAQKCVQIIDDLFKQLEYISQLHSELKCNQEAIENKVDDFMDIEISDLDKDAFINLSLETIISQYYHTESLIDGLSRDLERTER
ncbi:22926_t:CDS:2 [Gigaspora margarita]|uniref:22926_t:CDS:1 n=1 Tax=Gigaspora margarita TaxID=4874 RepID=A0ABN7USJ0_GIGMA|nr:22926_t:CDS:2 [Gigaspora margarita]